MRFIHEHRDQFAVALLLRVLNIGASTYYAWVTQAEQPCDRDLVDLGLISNIYEIWETSGRTYGADLVNRQFTADGPNPLWVADATRIPCGSAPCTAPRTDSALPGTIWSSPPVSHAVSPTISTRSCVPLTNCSGRATWSCRVRRSSLPCGVERRPLAGDSHGRCHPGTRGAGPGSPTVPTLSITRRDLSPRSSKRSLIAAMPESASTGTAWSAALKGPAWAAHARPVASIRTAPPHAGVPPPLRNAGNVSGTVSWTTGRHRSSHEFEVLGSAAR